MLPQEQVIGASGLSESADGAWLEMRLPWYRSLPLSTVRVEDCHVDGASVLEGARLLVDGRTFSLAQAREATDVYWFVLDSAYLLLPPLAPAAGGGRRVSLTLVLYPPYIAGMRREITEVRPAAARLPQ